MIPCEHCGNSDKSKWTTQCLYKGNWPSHTAFVRSTFDPPCACDDYDEGQRELARANNWGCLGAILLMLIAFAVAAKLCTIC